MNWCERFGNIVRSKYKHIMLNILWSGKSLGTFLTFYNCELKRSLITFGAFPRGDKSSGDPQQWPNSKFMGYPGFNTLLKVENTIRVLSRQSPRPLLIYIYIFYHFTNTPTQIFTTSVLIIGNVAWAKPIWIAKLWNKFKMMVHTKEFLYSIDNC